MFTNGDIINIVNLIRNKDVEGKDINADEWSSLITANSQNLFASLLGVPNLYQVNMAVERRGAEVSRVVSEKLRPFYVRESANVVGGAVDLSTKDIGYLLAVEPTAITGRGFDELEPSEVADRLGDPVVAPTLKDPCLEYSTAGDSILVYPSSMASVTLKYYKFPTDAVVVFTTDNQTLLQTYDEGNSTETGWKKNELLKIAYMCLRDLGVNMKESDVIAYSQNLVTNE